MSVAAWLERRRKRLTSRSAKEAGDPWICPYCRQLHPGFDTGGTPFAFGYPSVKFHCCGKVAFLYKEPKSGTLKGFLRIGEGAAEWMPQEAYFAWVAESNKARGHREGSPHKDVVAKGVVKDVAAMRPKPKVAEAPSTPAPPPAAPAPTPAAFVTVAKLEELPAGGGKVVEVQGKRIALFRLGDAVHAIDNTCAHAQQSLGDSAFEDGIVTCNGHGWRYDVRTGRCENRPDVAVRSYPVKLDGNAVLVGV